jgi:FMN-dependent NADH-azoreductase
VSTNTLLHLDSGADPERSLSRVLTAHFAEHWTGARSYRDLHADPLPHLEHSALHWPEPLRPAGVELPPGAEALQQELLAELDAADVLVVGAPMYNYSLPSTLKAWVDRIHVPGVTTGEGTQPHAGKRAVVVSTRGLTYDDGPTAGWDHAVPVLQIVLGEALGMQVEVVKVDFTLADTLPPLAEHSATFHAQRDAALSRLAELATSWSTDGSSDNS